MDIHLLLSAAIFGLVTSLTPGPNNTYLLISGINFGLRRSMPYLFGIFIGLSVIVFLVIFGLDLLFITYPVIYEILKWIGFAYICWMAFIIATSGTNAPEAKTEGIVGVWNAVFFQFVNPKAWIVSASFVAMFVPAGSGYINELVFGLVFAISSLPGAVVWATAGKLLRNWLTSPKKRKVFNGIASILLIASMLPVLFL